MAKPTGPWIGQLGLRLSLAFVGVALAAVGAAILLNAFTVNTDVDQLIRQQQVDLTQATEVAAAAAYRSHGWQEKKDLSPVTDLVLQAGAGVQVRDATGQVVDQSASFEALGSGPILRRAVLAHGRRVGTVIVKFDNRGLEAAIATFQAQRFRARVTAAGVAALIALIVALLVSRRITAPVDTMIQAVRDRGRGRRNARAGDVRGFSEIRELAVAFDQMADSVEERDRIRRNLVADVAHELRTPIAILQAGHEAVLDGLTKPTSVHIASLRDEVLRLARMVDDLQRLASAEAAALQLTLVPRDLAATVAAAADRLADSFDAADIALVRELDQIVVLCDPQRMNEIATNLLANAMKFTPSGGTVLVETGPDPQSAGELAVLRVRDTGIGIPADELPRVSERFFRGHNSTGTSGSGIGLTIVSELVRAHHGTMWISSEPDSGTEVTITLPVADGEAAVDRPAE
jgi:two-component system sensor histidine kinase BaeS